MHFPLSTWRPAWFLDDTVLKREGSTSQGRKLTYQALELGSNTFSVTLVAALGFFTGSYILFTSSVVTPMLNHVYWNNSSDSSPTTAFNDATTGGVAIGMLFFGFMADRFGRRKMYKFELIILMAGTLGVVMSSAGYVPFNQNSQESSGSIDYSSFGSMDISSWLFFWRFVSGIGIGGEYPLSAVIASEYAPTAKRPRILTIVFAMQALAVASGSVVSIVVTSIVQARYPYDTADPISSSRAVDQIWRWVVGLGLIPAAFTALLRFTIPESPRYTLDVLNDPLRASEETEKLKGWGRESELESCDNITLLSNGGGPASPFTSVTDVSIDPMPGLSVKEYFWMHGNWRYVIGTSLSWFLFDFATSMMSLNETTTLSSFWNGSTPAKSSSDGDIFVTLTNNSVHELVIDNLATILGALLLVVFVNHVKRKMLIWTMFLATGSLLLIMGVVLIETFKSQNFSINIGLFAITKFSIAFGVSPLIFLLPAELFPTKYRAGCYAISAASGKIGSLLASAIFGNITFGSDITQTDAPSLWLGYVFIISAFPMFLGAIVSWLWIPEVQEPSGSNKTLEQLAEGRK